MTPEEVELLQNAGRFFSQDIGIALTQTALYGLYLALFSHGVRALLGRQSKTKYTWILLGFLSILFLLLTTSFAINIFLVLGFIRGVLVENPDLPLPDRIQLAQESLITLDRCSLWFGAGSSGGLFFVFADAIVVWRAWVLWLDSKIARAIPLFLLLASFVFSIAAAAMNTLAIGVVNVIPTSSAEGIISTFSFSLSLATNVIATALIGYRAFQYRKTATAERKSSRSGIILLFLTESGIVFCILQIICIATTASVDTPGSALDTASSIWQQITVFAAASYPIMVVIIVDNHRSISDRTGFSADSGFTPGSDNATRISFAVRPAASASDVEANRSFADVQEVSVTPDSLQNHSDKTG